jgi:hypothetical protein
MQAMKRLTMYTKRVMVGMRRKRKKSNDATTRSTCSSSVLNLVQSDVAIIENAALQIHTVWGKSTWQ